MLSMAFGISFCVHWVGSMGYKVVARDLLSQRAVVTDQGRIAKQQITKNELWNTRGMIKDDGVYILERISVVAHRIPHRRFVRQTIATRRMARIAIASLLEGDRSHGRHFDCTLGCHGGVLYFSQTRYVWDAQGRFHFLCELHVQQVTHLLTLRDPS